MTSLRFGLLVGLVFVLGGCPKSPLANKADAGDSGGASSAFDASPPDSGAIAEVIVNPDAGFDEGVMPPIAAEELTLRMRHLVEAIGHDNADLAQDVLFPRDAFIQVKDAADPGKAWEKLQFAFRKAVHSNHTHLKGMESAALVTFELGRTVNLAPAKKHEFKKALWRARHSKITFSVGGKTNTMEIVEMTAWHGSWYITKLR